MIRKDFFELVDYAVDHGIGVKFSTNGTFLDAAAARRLAAMDYIDVQISLDGADAADQRPRPRRRLVRHGPPGDGPPRRRRLRAVQDLASSSPATTSTSSTTSRRSPTPTAPSCGSPACARRAAAPTRGTSCTRPTTSSARSTDWLLAHGEDVLTGDSFFHLNALGEPLPGLNMCGAGRVVCLIDPIGDVYACPFVIHDEFKAGSVRDAGGFTSSLARERAVPVAARAAVGRGVRAAAAATTPARAAAWRPSSSPGCRSTAPTPSASTATARPSSSASAPVDPPPDDGPLPQGARPRHVPPPLTCPTRPGPAVDAPSGWRGSRRRTWSDRSPSARPRCPVLLVLHRSSPRFAVASRLPIGLAVALGPSPSSSRARRSSSRVALPLSAGARNSVSRESLADVTRTRDAPCSNRSPSVPGPRRTASCSGPTSPTSVTTTGAYRTPHRLLRAPGPGRLRHDRRRGRQRPPVGLALRAGPAGRAVPRPGGPRSSPPAARTARSSSPRSTTPAGRARRPTARRRCGRRRGSPRSTRREVPKWMEADDIAAVVDGFARAAGWPSRPAATASRSTPASTAWCASSSPG